MRSRQSVAELGFLRLDGRKKQPLVKQLYESIRRAILQGTLKPSCRLPSSRDLVEQLSVSRTTVVAALDRLVAEGYLQSAQGRGTFVSRDLPEEGPFAETTSGSERPRTADLTIDAAELSPFGQQLELEERMVADRGTPKPFCPGEPALDAFPTDVWSRIVRKVWKTVSPADLSYGEAGGQLGLRRAVADYLRTHRGVECDTRQVMIVNGTQQALDVVTRVVLKPGDQVLFENPGYTSARQTFAKQGAQIVPMTIDAGGAKLDTSVRQACKARLVYVTPSHQYPLGVTMPIERRLEILNWAARSSGWILEDDYDSEYRYGQAPVPCLQGLDRAHRTFYVGSFSKVIFPALGLGYLIVPPGLTAAFEQALRIVSRPASQIDQLVLMEFIRDGHFGRHLRRMRKTHGLRRRVFVEELSERLGKRLQIIGSQAGLHCTALLKSKKTDIRAEQELAAAGILVRSLSAYYCSSTPRAKRQKGLVFGFACATPAQIRRGLAKVAEVL